MGITERQPEESDRTERWKASSDAHVRVRGWGEVQGFLPDGPSRRLRLGGLCLLDSGCSLPDGLGSRRHLSGEPS